MKCEHLAILANSQEHDQNIETNINEFDRLALPNCIKYVHNIILVCLYGCVSP